MEREYKDMQIATKLVGSNEDYPGMELIATVKNGEEEPIEVAIVRFFFDVDTQRFKIHFWGPWENIEDREPQQLLFLELADLPNFKTQWKRAREIE